MAFPAIGKGALAGVFFAPAVGVLLLLLLMDATPAPNAATVARAGLAYYFLALLWLGPVAGLTIYAGLWGAAAARGRLSPILIAAILLIAGGVLGAVLGIYFAAGGAPLPHGKGWWEPQDFRVAGVLTGVICGLGCGLIHARSDHHA
jgi:hypothetical protein